MATRPDLDTAVRRIKAARAQAFKRISEKPCGEGRWAEYICDNDDSNKFIVKELDEALQDLASPLAEGANAAPPLRVKARKKYLRGPDDGREV